MPKRKAPEGEEDDSAAQDNSRITANLNEVEVLEVDDASDDNNNDDNIGEDDVDVTATEGVSSPSMQSPTTKETAKDMKLRSGRKKRRRSLGTTGLTPPEGSTRRRSRRSVRLQSGIDTSTFANENISDAEGAGEDEEDDQDELMQVSTLEPNSNDQPQDETAQVQVSANTDSPMAAVANGTPTKETTTIPAQRASPSIVETVEVESPLREDNGTEVGSTMAVAMETSIKDDLSTKDGLSTHTGEVQQAESTSHTVPTIVGLPVAHVAEPPSSATASTNPAESTLPTANGHHQQPQDDATNGNNHHQPKKFLEKIRPPSQHTPGNLRETERRPLTLQNAPDLGGSKRLLFGAPTGNDSAAAAFRAPADETELLNLPPSQHQQQQHSEVLYHRNGRNDLPSLPNVDSMQQEDSSTVREDQSKLNLGDDSYADEDEEDYGDDDDFEDDDYEDEIKPTHLSKAWVWFIIFLVTQMVFNKIWINPIMGSVMGTTGILLRCYQRILLPSSRLSSSVPENVVPSPEEADITIDPASEESCNPSAVFDILRQFEDKIASLEGNKRSISSRRRDVSSYSTHMSHQLDYDVNHLKTQKELLESIRDSLVLALEAETVEDPSWEEARRAVNLAENPMWQIIDTPGIQIWDVGNPPECLEDDGVVDEEEEDEDEDDQDYIVDDQQNDDGPVLSVDDLAEPAEMIRKIRELRLLSRQTSQQVRRNNDIPTSIQANIQEILKETNAADLVEEGKTIIQEKSVAPEVSAGNLPEGAFERLDDVSSAVQELIDFERADRTGVLDFASVILGAKVIRDGPRATSKSVVESLPLGNRIQALLGLKFYGYGPEAALAPTNPIHTSGQCWSFQPTVLSDKAQRERRLSGDMGMDDQYNGHFGTLSLQLAHPIQVRSVVIEHPPLRMTGQNSAIRSARVLGYTTPDATGKPWSIGSFEFDPKEGDLQEFDVATEIGDVPVPPLWSVTLAIDSNWGNEYSCLYRFRVHGDPVNLDQPSL